MGKKENESAKRVPLSYERRSMWADYMRAIAERIGLTHWTLMVPNEVPEKHHMAENLCTYGQHLTRITLAHDFDEQDPDSQRETVVHELVHCFFTQCHTQQSNTLTRFLKPKVADHENATFDYLFEFGIDAVARALSPYMPLPAEIVPGLAPKEHENA